MTVSRQKPISKGTLIVAKKILYAGPERRGRKRKGEWVTIKKIVYQGPERRGGADRRTIQRTHFKIKDPTHFGRRKEEYRELRKTDFTQQPQFRKALLQHIGRNTRDVLSQVARNEGITIKETRKKLASNGYKVKGGFPYTENGETRWLDIQLNLQNNKLEWRTTRRLFSSDRRIPAIVEKAKEKRK